MKFTRRARLTTRAQYRHVFDQPEISRDRFFRVFSRVNGLDYCRLGLAVSRKVSDKAVERNRIKRLVRESFRRHQQELAEPGGRDIVVLPNAGAATICTSDLSESLAQHWLKVQTGRPQETGGQHRNLH